MTKKSDRTADYMAVDRPDGAYTFGLHNPALGVLLAVIVTRITHLEEQFIGLVALLVGCDDSTGRLIFRSIHSEASRIEVVRSLFEKLPDDTVRLKWKQAVDVFGEIKKARNRYVHGFWMTHNLSNRAFLTNDLKVDAPMFYGLEVDEWEMKELVIKINHLEVALLELRRPGVKKHFETFSPPAIDVI